MAYRMQLDPDGKIRPHPIPWTEEQTRACFHASYVIVDLGYETPCWKWTACCHPTGYGVIKFRGKNYPAHRYSLLIHKGDPPSPKLLACHKCDQPGCVNPEHLYWGTHWRNTRDMIERGRAVHPKGEECSYAKLNTKTVLLIRELRSQGLSYGKIAERTGASVSQVKSVIRGETWGHVP